MRHYQNILFDLDGTLADSEAGIVGGIVYALEQMHVPVPPCETLRRFIGPPLKDSFAGLMGEDRAEKALDYYRLRYDEQGGMFDCILFPEIPGLLQKLRDGGKTLYVATAKPHVMASKILAHFGILDYFAAVHGPELDGTRNDKGQLIKYLLEQHGLEAAASVMIGDRRHDIVAARQNHVDTIGVLWGFGSRGELETAGADAIVEQPEELLPLLTA